MFIKLYVTALGLFFALDMLWLGFFAKNFYKEHLGFLMSSSPQWFVVVLFYLLFIAGLVFFVLLPAFEKDMSWIHVLLVGALFGLITYATYDLTNMATLNNWPILVTIVDLAWGAFICGVVSILTYLIVK